MSHGNQMKDSYLNFTNMGIGARLTSILGLPRPEILERYETEKPTITGAVLLGGGGKSELLEVLATLFESMRTQTLFHSQIPEWLKIANDSGLITGRWEAEGTRVQKVKALVFDATGLKESSESEALHRFFHDSAKSILTCGRVIVFGRTPEHCNQPRKAAMQAGLEGLIRSLAKEYKRGVAAQLVYVAEGAENQMESTLRFLLSPRSAYVSGQVIRIAKPKKVSRAPRDWSAPLSGKKILVTGSARGIGTAIAEVMARDGAKVICLDIPQAQSELEKLAAKLDGSALAVDLTGDDAPETLVSEAQAGGGWDVIVHNAGITRDKKMANMRADLWNSVVDVNLSAQERINDALLGGGAINKSGRIICVSSISGIAGNVGQANYAFSKAGVIGMVKSLAPSLARQGITINAVAPGFIETQMTASMPLGVREAGRRLNSMQQGGQPEDVAEAVAWFASSGSGGVTGNIIRVCGQSLLGA